MTVITGNAASVYVASPQLVWHRKNHKKPVFAAVQEEVPTHKGSGDHRDLEFVDDTTVAAYG